MVTNADAPLSKALVRRAHEQVVGEICKYLAKTSSTTPIQTHVEPPPAPPTPEGLDTEAEETEPSEPEATQADKALDQETARSR